MSAILFQISEGVATITLNRPDKLNAFDREMALLFQQKLDEAAGLQEVRCVVITGAGKGFSAGQDLAELIGNNPPSMSQILSEYYNPIVTRIRNLPKPVVAAVNGVAAGAGANIALCCDIVVAKSSASFIQAFSKIGLIPDSGGTYFLPRLIGWQKALALAMLGDKIGAAEAAQLGMIYRSFDEDAFESSVATLSRQLAQMPTRGLALTKQAFNQSLNNNLETQLTLEDALQQEAALTYDYREGVEAFLQKRTPKFEGR
ncbi:MAG: 2-(1,2-epoxy-1,2-dihydrophenyl)acetyl-CoA isomerase [Bacteroidetes bacterium]|nr:2-(1,2-epoxy-1,2-dihydrophenyl)acetyl-CoA isomerase [Bacteroidota bacterium]